MLLNPCFFYIALLLYCTLLLWSSERKETRSLSQRCPPEPLKFAAVHCRAEEFSPSRFSMKNELPTGGGQMTSVTKSSQ